MKPIPVLMVTSTAAIERHDTAPQAQRHAGCALLPALSLTLALRRGCGPAAAAYPSRRA